MRRAGLLAARARLAEVPTNPEQLLPQTRRGRAHRIGGGGVTGEGLGSSSIPQLAASGAVRDGRCLSGRCLSGRCLSRRCLHRRCTERRRLGGLRGQRRLSRSQPCPGRGPAPLTEVAAGHQRWAPLRRGDRGHTGRWHFLQTRLGRNGEPLGAAHQTRAHPQRQPMEPAWHRGRRGASAHAFLTTRAHGPISEDARWTPSATRWR